MTTDVHIDVADHVAKLGICRPPNNFFDVALITQLADALDSLAASDDCRAVVLCSQGKHFCAGADFQSDDSPSEPGPHLYDVAIRLFEQPLPIVAAVQGAAIGGGLGLALAADFRVASAESRFAANFAQLGFHHGFGLTVTLPLVVGHQAALDLLYTGRRIRGEEAYGLGLCDLVVPGDKVRDAAVALAADIVSSAPLAVRGIRHTMRGPLVDAVRAACAHERSEQERLMATSDWREGLAAAAERRPPTFQGR